MGQSALKHKSYMQIAPPGTPIAGCKALLSSNSEKVGCCRLKDPLDYGLIQSFSPFVCGSTAPRLPCTWMPIYTSTEKNIQLMVWVQVHNMHVMLGTNNDS